MNTTQFNAKIDELWAATKRGELPRAARFEAIERLTNEYIAATGKRPEPAQLDRLATLCLYEEVTDATPWKTKNTEYPIHSEEQRNQIEKNEARFEHADGNKFRKPVRRKRSDYENTVIDRRAMNAERKRKYRDFTKVQPVVRWDMNTGEIYE
ncbi:hypothetical protein [Neobacillus mesonae]|uniref:Uncharacterized protein n=1 Tax=Neobacillus mesonae TaxID=1193713 RepID=A0A3T0HV71_9BACI|nr:hypothetical protein [Neobacillus mesonae]AZU61054.1 hypothetical protein CHR53_07190 [Neobacillus mesonae]